MKALFFVYDHYAEFEVSLLALFLKNFGKIVTVGNKAKGEVVTGEGGFRTLPHLELSEVNPSEYDVLVFPGGNVEAHLGHSEVLAMTRAFAEQGKLVAGICGGTAFMGEAGLFNGKRYVHPFTEPEEQEKFGHLFPAETVQPGEDIVIDGNVLTGREGCVYVEFAVAVTKYFDLFESEQDERENLLYFKNQYVKS
ncbi:MAG TPA: DJ-1/PfpI family protein [Bacilli bacterium]|nr:DJ-1/PfpI family protein [Bacilli bacterium]